MSRRFFLRTRMWGSLRFEEFVLRRPLISGAVAGALLAAGWIAILSKAPSASKAQSATVQQTIWTWHDWVTGFSLLVYLAVGAVGFMLCLLGSVDLAAFSKKRRAAIMAIGLTMIAVWYAVAVL